MRRVSTRQAWRGLILAPVILAAAALAGCHYTAPPAPHEFDGSWAGPVFQVWFFDSDGGTYASTVGGYNFDFTYLSVDEGAGQILINVSTVNGHPPSIHVGTTLYVEYFLSGDQMYITFDPNSYITPDTSPLSTDGPYNKQ